MATAADRRNEHRARELAEAALNPSSELYRKNGPDRLLRAAQVYALLVHTSTP